MSALGINPNFFYLHYRLYMLQNRSIGFEKCQSHAGRGQYKTSLHALPRMNALHTQYLNFAAFIGDSEDRKNLDLSREWTDLDRPYSQSVVVQH